MPGYYDRSKLERSKRPDPTPEEIRTATQLLKDSWTPEEERKHARKPYRADRYTIPGGENPVLLSDLQGIIDEDKPEELTE